MNWTATIEWRKGNHKETVIGPLGSIAYHLRQNAEEILHVELWPEYKPLAKHYLIDNMADELL